MRSSLLIILFSITIGSYAQTAILSTDPELLKGCETLTVETSSSGITGEGIDSLIIDFGDGYGDTIINAIEAQKYTHTHTYKDVGDYTITLSIINDGSLPVTKTKQVNIYPTPDSSFSFETYGLPGENDTFYYSNKQYIFIGLYPNVSIHTWLIDGVTQFSKGDTMGYNFITIGDHSITHTIDVSNCFSTSTQTINIIDKDIKIPNIFSPNNDGINDVFYIQTDGNMIYKFTVRDRNGSRVYTSEGKVISWNGRAYWGEQLHPGNYYFSLESSTGEIQTGIIYLAR